jgi:epoxyqueuosine reductase
MSGRIGNHLFGCDVCQMVCPWNRRTPTTAEAAFEPGKGMNPVRLAELRELDEEAFRRRFRHTPLWRAKRQNILRNASAILER